MSEHKVIAGEVEGDASVVKVQLAAIDGDKVVRPTKGTQVVWGGTGPSSPWAHLVSLIEKAGGSVNYTFVHAADLKAEPVVVDTGGTPDDRLLAPGEKPPETNKSAKPAPEQPAAAKKPAPAQPEPEHTPAAAGDAKGLGAMGVRGTGPLFERGVEFEFAGHTARVWAHPLTFGRSPKPLVVGLHGNNANDRANHPFLTDKGLHVGKVLSPQIDAGEVRPLLIACPTEFTNNGWSGFDLHNFVAAVAELVEPLGVQVDLSNVSLMGHSGAGGNAHRGVNLIAEQHAMFGEHKLHVLGIADTCIMPDRAKAYAEGLSANDTTAIYSVHRETGGWGSKFYVSSKAWADALGAKQTLGEFVGNESKVKFKDAYTNGSTPLRVSVKLTQEAVDGVVAEWRAAGGYPAKSRMGLHWDMVPSWFWLAAPRLFAGTAEDKTAASSQGHSEDRGQQQSPPEQTITGGEWADVPAAAAAWSGGDVEPMPTGEALFAPPSGLFWPVRAPKGHYGRAVSYIGVDGKGHGAGGSASGRNFLAARPAGDPSPNRYHVGIDVYGDFHDVVVACEAGEIIRFDPFYHGVYRLLVKCDSGIVINYGEVDAGSLRKFNLHVGDRVQAGQPIGEVGRMIHDSMLHFETYPAGATTTRPYYRSEGEASRKHYLNPTQYLLALAKRGR